MLSIQLYDNDFYGSPLKVVEDNNNPQPFNELSENQKSSIRKALDYINNVSLKELESKGAIIFPSKTVESELKEDNKFVCSVQNLETDSPIIKTSNVMGFFGINNEVQISIHSRFDKADKQYFLHYMLQKVCNVSPTVDLVNTNKTPLFEFIVYLFPSFLRKAVTQGIYRTYITNEYNDSNVRGTIDFFNHFRYNIPFNGKIAYKTREYNHDNYVTQLVRHTIEFIAENNKLKKILTLNEDICNDVFQIRECTEKYIKASRSFIINKNLNPLTNPYFTEYEKLRRLCIMILTHDKISYSQANDNQVNGILFDGASLWEEYLASVFQNYFKKNKTDIIVEHPNNRTGEGRKYLFETPNGNENTAIYPDFIFKDIQHNYLSILDAKYKHLEGANISREDYFQLLSYLFRFDCKRGILLYPYTKKEKKSEATLFLAKHDKNVILSTYGLELYDYDTNCKYDFFCEEMRKKECNYCSALVDDL